MAAKFSIQALVARIIVNTVALFVVIKTIKGLNITTHGLEGFWTLVVTAVVIGVINAVIKPVLVFLTLPISIMTFGIFTLLLNALMFALAGWIVPGFEVTSLLGAILGSLLFSLISFIGGLFIGMNEGVRVKYKVID
jgi:putative membrane protein